MSKDELTDKQKYKIIAAGSTALACLVLFGVLSVVFFVLYRFWWPPYLLALIATVVFAFFQFPRLVKFHKRDMAERGVKP